MKHRKTNIELFRISCMFLIIICHFIIQSEITEFTTGNKFVNFFGYWGGSIGNVGFICITAWYLDKFQFSSKKIGLLIAKTFFYSVLSLGIAIAFYRPEITGSYLLKCFFPIIYGGYGYVTAFVAFYFMAPFLKRILLQLDRQTHRKLLIIGSVVLFFVPAVFLGSHSNMMDLFWIFIAVSVGGAYVKRYGVRWASDRRLQAKVCAVSFFLMVCFALGCLFLKGFIPQLGSYSSEWARYYSPFMIAAIASLFFLFSTWKIKESKAINWIADRTFGVFLLHAAPAIRGYYWVKTFHVHTWGTKKLFPFMMLGLCLLIYVLCILADGAIAFVIQRAGKGFHSERLESVCKRMDTWMNGSEQEG